MSTIVVKYSPNFGYGTSNANIVNSKQYIQNGATNSMGGMPQKTGYADGTSTFSEGRNQYYKAPVCSAFVQDSNKKLNCNTGVIRVDFKPNIDNNSSNNLYCNNNIQASPIVANGAQQLKNTWSTSNHTIHNRRRNMGCGGSAPATCLINGKQNNIMSAQELINRRKNITIGRASTVDKNNNGLSFNDNNLNGAHTNYLAVSNAKRRTRNGGYVVPPKCRGHGSGPTGPYGSLGNAGTGYNIGQQVSQPKTACGNNGWSNSTLLGNNILTDNTAYNNVNTLERTSLGVVNKSTINTVVF